MSFIRTFWALWAAICNIRCITVRIISDPSLITVFAFMAVVKSTKIHNLITTLMGGCQGTLTVPAIHHSLPIFHWRDSEGGVSHISSQRLLGRAPAP